MEIKDKYTLKEALAIIAKHMQGLVKADSDKFYDSSESNVVGKTRSGKSVYSEPHHVEHDSFSATDHFDAAQIHNKSKDRASSTKSGKHMEMARKIGPAKE